MIHNKTKGEYTLADPYQPVENKTEKLREAQKAKDDEFYTKREDVEFILDFLAPVLEDFDFVFCPCDGDESEFTKCLKERGIPVRYIQDMDAVFETSENFLVLTNPPFSKNIDWIDRLIEEGKTFCILSNVLCGSKNWERIMRGELFTFQPGSYTFQHISGKERGVPCVWLHNVKKVKKVKKVKFSVKITDDGIPLLKQVADFYKHPTEFKPFSRLYVPVTYLYEEPFEGWHIVRLAKNVTTNGKKEFTKVLIEKD